MSKKSKPLPEPPPPTVLVITLEQDGTGSLLARRGDLAHLSQFTYRSLAEIVTAMQASAEQLLHVEQNPPVVDVTPDPASTDGDTSDNSDIAEETPSDSAGEPDQLSPDTIPVPLPAAQNAQMKLM